MFRVLPVVRIIHILLFSNLFSLAISVFRYARYDGFLIRLESCVSRQSGLQITLSGDQPFRVYHYVFVRVIRQNGLRYSMACLHKRHLFLSACLPVSPIHYTLTLAELLKRQERERMYFNKTESRCTALGTSSKFREAFCELSGSTLQLRTLTNIHLYPPPPLTHRSPPPRLTYLSRNRKLGTGLRFQCCEAFRRTGSRGLPTTSQLALRKAGLTSQLEEGDKFIIRTGNPP